MQNNKVAKLCKKWYTEKVYIEKYFALNRGMKK